MMNSIGKYFRPINWIPFCKRTLVQPHPQKEAWNSNMDRQSTRSELKAFCEDSTIYGLRYFVNSRRPWEKLFWISFLFLGIFLSVLIVRKSLIDWEVRNWFWIYTFPCQLYLNSFPDFCYIANIFSEWPALHSYWHCIVSRTE